MNYQLYVEKFSNRIVQLPFSFFIPNLTTCLNFDLIMLNSMLPHNFSNYFILNHYAFRLCRNSRKNADFLKFYFVGKLKTLNWRLKEEFFKESRSSLSDLRLNKYDCLFNGVLLHLPWNHPPWMWCQGRENPSSACSIIPIMFAIFVIIVYR